MNVVILNLANQTPEELLGYPDGNGGYIRPNWMSDDKRGTIYFLDEINRAPKYVLQSIFNFVNEGRLHTHRIQANDYVIAGANPDGEYEVTSFEDPAFLSRWCHVYLAPQISEFKSYLSENGVNSAISMFLDESPNYASSMVGEGLNLKLTPDNRALFRIGQLMNLEAFNFASNGFIVMAGMVGEETAVNLKAAFDKLSESIDPDVILNGDLSAIKKAGVDKILAANTKLANHIVKNFKTITADQFTNIFKYCDTIPKDSCLAFVAEIKNHDSKNYMKIMESIFAAPKAQKMLKSILGMN